MALYRVNEAEGSLSGIPETSLSGEGKRERGDLQRWLRDRPDALEPDLFVLAEEYSDWADSSRSIDLLALDGDGRLVVIELKRDEGAFMDLQALRYASMVAHMTFAQAVDAHARYLGRRHLEGDAQERILDHLRGADTAEPEVDSARPRIILAARDFPQELTTSVLWLNDAGLDIRCVRLLPYRVGDDLLLDVTQVIPLPEAEDYTVRIRDREAEQERRDYPEVDWTREDMEALARQLPSPVMLAILDACSASPGNWVSWGDIRTSLDDESVSVPTHAIKALTIRAKRHFGRSNWPMEYEWPGYPDGDRRIFHMSGEIAEWWRAARESAVEDGAGSGE
ncbi:MAG: hypothetical protein OXC71_08985 [Chloroflexi bacterium]|nr:hypothetical protein [Chloroflexota bacterium]